MRVEITGRVAFRGAVLTSGVVEVPEVTGKHWVATGAARLAVNPPAPAPAPAADGGKKSRF